MLLQRKLGLSLFGFALVPTLIAGVTAYAIMAMEIQASQRRALDAVAVSKAEAVYQAVRGWRDKARLLGSRTRMRRELAAYQADSDPSRLEIIRGIMGDAMMAERLIVAWEVRGRDGAALVASEQTLLAREPRAIDLPEAANQPRSTEGTAAIGRPVLLALRPDEDSGAAVLLRVPLRLDGEPIGALRLWLGAPELAAVAQDTTGLGQSGETVLATRDGDGALFIAALRHDPAAAFQRRVAQGAAEVPIQAAVFTGTQMGRRDFIDYRGVPTVFAARQLPTIGGAIVTKIDRAEAEAPVRRLRNLILLGIGLLLPLAWLLAQRLAHGTVKPLQEVAHALQRIERGQFDARAPASRRDELGDLARRVNTMAQRLGQHSSMLAASERRFRTAFDDAAIGMALVSLEGRWMQVNQALCDMLGYAEAELLATDFQTVTHPGDLETDLDLVRQLLDGEINRYSMIKRYYAKDGAVVMVRLNVSLIRGGDAKPRHFVAQIEDISAEYEARAELADSRKQLERSNAELMDFAHTAAHDLKEPLRTISNFAAFIAEDYGDKLDDDGREMLTMMRQSATRLSGLVSELLRYARTGRDELRREPVDLRELVHALSRELQASLDEKGVELSLDEPLPTLSCDRLRLNQIMQNLLGNAIKYNRSKPPKIHIGSRDAKPVVVTVADNGIGIDPIHHEKVFGIFKRLNDEAEFAGGHGAGLSIVRKLVESHGGRIWVESEVGQGACFCFTLEPEERSDEISHEIEVEQESEKSESGNRA